MPWTIIEQLKDHIGIVFSFISALLWAFNGLASSIATKTYSTTFVAFVCSLSYIFAPFFIRWENTEHYNSVDTVIVIFVGTFEICSVYLSLLALSLAPLGNTIAIIFSKAILCVLLSTIFLNEDLFIIDILLILANIGGLIFIAKPHFIFGHDVDDDDESDHNLIGAVAALGAAISASFTFILVRKLVERDTYDPYVILLLKSIVGFGLFGLELSINSTPFMNIPSGYDWLQLVFVCTTGVGACATAYLALQTEGAGTVAVISTLQVGISYVLQVAFTDETVSLLSILGAVLILFAPFWYGIRETLRKDSNESLLNSD
ncbi:solute carrier family 35 member G1-like [Apostichopus japonicus]|uniref:solute carrier family 35 member G1-like n=1 Tax=Stichopus japonicus TaxID=307972 RepID=UPI003AB4154E